MGADVGRDIGVDPSRPIRTERREEGHPGPGEDRVREVMDTTSAVVSGS